MPARSVWVLRHAKAAAGDVDHERPLTGRGRRQARQLRDHLAVLAGRGGAGDPDVGGAVGLPELVLTSSARRARETAELATATVVAPEALRVEGALYQADADDVVGVLAGAPDDVAAVMVVGHNPTLHDLVLLLLDAEDRAGRAHLEPGFPTAALAVLRVAAPSWDRLRAGAARLVELWTPPR